MRNVVLVVDMVRGFYDIGPLANPRTARIVPNVVNLLERKIADGWLPVFLNDNHDPDDQEFDRFPPHCIVDSPEIELIPELEKFRYNSLIFCKKSFSGFFGTTLNELLCKERPEKVIVVGVCTDICVLHTVAGLYMRGYHQIIVPKDCTETFSAPGHSAKKIKRWAYVHMTIVLGATIVQSQKEI